MVITEIFKSIQGESTYAGLPCVFVRLTGCNLRCTWCDTAYAFYGGTKMSVEEVFDRVALLSRVPQPRSEHARPAQAATPAPVGSRPAEKPTISLVELTGGEPLLQHDVYPLAERLLAAGYTVMMETSGERYVGKLPREVVKIVDVKCPDSGEADTFDPANLDVLDHKDEIKFVISGRRDYEFAREFTARHGLPGRVHQVIFSPVVADPGGSWPGMNARELAEWILGDGLPVRLGMQLHKFIWDPATRGV
jgi:7-carboxy-7-deazaguanine synthase